MRFHALHYMAGFLFAATLFGQPASNMTNAPATQPAATPATPPPAPPQPFAAPAPFEVGKLKVSGMADGYYTYNFNKPSTGINQYYSFNWKDSWNLNMARVAVDWDADPVGFHFEAGTGRAYQEIRLSENPEVGKWSEYLPQFYVSLKPKSWKGLQFDVGKFYTSAGAEVSETYPNWNYSRSLIFNFGPYYHFGLRVNKPWNDKFSTGIQVVNGWNNINGSVGGPTIGLTSTATFGKLGWANNFYVGPAIVATGTENRYFYDTVVTYTVSDKLSTYVNFDFGRQKLSPGVGQTIVAVAGAARYQLTPRFAIAPRLEFYNDMNGFATGTAQTIKEFTMTGEVKLIGALMSRVEYRHDWSNQASYTAAYNRSPLYYQNTFTVGLVAMLGKMH
jgi:hypothetical protein